MRCFIIAYATITATPFTFIKLWILEVVANKTFLKGHWEEHISKKQKFDKFWVCEIEEACKRRTQLSK